MKYHFRAGHLAQLGLFVSGIALTCWAVACGSSAPPDPAVTGFDGVYQTENTDGDSPDDISTVGFANGQDYVLMTGACSDASCAEIGTYYYDEAAKSLYFTNSKTGVQRAVSVEVVSTESVADGTVKTQTDDQVISGGNNVIVNGSGNNIVINQNSPVASASSSAIVKRCPPGTTPGGTTTVGKTTSGTGASGGDQADKNLPTGVITASLHVQLGVAPLASSATDGCVPLKPTALAKSAKIKTKSGNQKLLNKDQSRLNSGTGGGPSAGSPGTGNGGTGSPGSGIPNLPQSAPPNNTNNGTDNSAASRVAFCSQLANQSTTSITARQKQIIFMQCMTAAASQV